MNQECPSCGDQFKTMNFITENGTTTRVFTHDNGQTCLLPFHDIRESSSIVLSDEIDDNFEHIVRSMIHRVTIKHLDLVDAIIPVANIKMIRVSPLQVSSGISVILDRVDRFNKNDDGLVVCVSGNPVSVAAEYSPYTNQSSLMRNHVRGVAAIASRRCTVITCPNDHVVVQFLMELDEIKRRR